MLASRRLTAGLQCKITDFGLSSQLSQSHSLVKTRVGTPYYMAPEVFRLKPYGAPADVWSFGVVAFELLALERPFRAGSLVEPVLLVCLRKQPDDVPCEGAGACRAETPLFVRQ